MGTQASRISFQPIPSNAPVQVGGGAPRKRHGRGKRQRRLSPSANSTSPDYSQRRRAALTRVSVSKEEEQFSYEPIPVLVDEDGINSSDGSQSPSCRSADQNSLSTSSIDNDSWTSPPRRRTRGIMQIGRRPQKFDSSSSNSSEESCTSVNGWLS